MKHRGRMVFVGRFLSCGAALLLTCFGAAAQDRQPTEAEVWQSIIRSSIASYSRSCPCPYSADRVGQRCGDRSAYRRGDSSSPMCYPQDIPDEQVARQRERLRSEWQQQQQQQ